MESVKWNNPTLTFRIERHGGAVMGSSRAELQHWEVDLTNQTIELTKIGHRQIHQMKKRVSIKPQAKEIVQEILRGAKTDYLKRNDDGSVNVVMGKIYPTSSGFKRTIEGRRKRLRDELEISLNKHGWSHMGRNRFMAVERRGV